MTRSLPPQPKRWTGWFVSVLVHDFVDEPLYYVPWPKQRQLKREPSQSAWFNPPWQHDDRDDRVWR